MILRRVIAHFRKQEWTAIAIDFVIVVIGVFVGIQVSNWNAARAERDEEREIVGRLLDEVDRSVAEQEASAQFVGEKAALARAASEMLQGADADAIDGGALRAAILSLGEWPTAGVATATLNELYGSGKIDLIRSSGLRRVLSTYRDRVHVLSIDNLGQMNLDHVMTIYDRLTLQWTDAGPVITTPTGALLADPAIESRINQIAFVYTTMQPLFAANIGRTRELQTVLASYAADIGVGR